MENHTNTVKCGVTDCAHYNENRCVANHITIGGENATTADATRCETFVNSGNMVNSCGCSAKGGETTIHCEAKECSHNRDCRCMLSDVDVACSCASCDCGSTEQTLCSSFKL